MRILPSPYPYRKCASALKKKRSSQKFFRRSPKKNVFQKIFQALHKILTIQKIVLSLSRGQANFWGLEASRPRTSKYVLEDSTSDNYDLKFSITIVRVIVIQLQLQWKDSQNIATNSLTYEASSFTYVNTVDLFCISITDLSKPHFSILVLPSIFFYL